MTYIVEQTRVKHFDDQTRTKREVNEYFHEIDAKVAPFTHFAKKNAKVTTSPKFESFSRGSALRYTLVNHGGGYTTETSIVVDDGTVFRINDTLFNPVTQEIMYITNIVGNTLTVVRNIGGTSVAVIADNQPLYASGGASPEGDTKMTTVTGAWTEDYNYTQIFRTTLEITRTAMKTAVYGPQEVADDKARKYRQHLMEMETAFLFGQRHKITSGDEETRFTRGIVAAIGTSGSNYYDVSGNLTKANLDGYLSGIFTYGNESRVRIGFCNMTFMKYLNTLVNSYLQKELDGSSLFKISFQDYQNYAGILKCTEHRMLTRLYSGSEAVLLTVDPDYIRYRPLTDSDTMWLEASRDTNLLDGYIGEYLTETGLEVLGTEMHGWLHGATGTA
jgi:hypothetical protein